MREWRTELPRDGVSWDDIIGYLNAFPELQRWYYEEVIKVSGAKDLDEVILTTIAMAFGRPAFEVPLHCENPDEFLQALSDTQRAVRTGELLDRESRHPIRKSIGGWRDIDDTHVRDGVRLVDKALRHLRTQIEQGSRISEYGGCRASWTSPTCVSQASWNGRAMNASTCWTAC